MRCLLPVAGLLLLATGGCLNLDVVDEGRLYRSAQPSPDELRDLIEEYGLRTVVNLRGPAPDKEWLAAEQEVCREAGVTHEDVRLSARRFPTAAEMLRLLDVYDTAIRPVLIHCLGGADRSGLAAALWRIHVAGDAPQEARRQLALRYGHLGWIRGREELGQFLDLYAATSGGKDLRRWLAEDYDRLRP